MLEIATIHISSYSVNKLNRMFLQDYTNMHYAWMLDMKWN